MELEKQLKQIEILKTDKHMTILLSGLRAFGSIENMSSSLLDKYKVKNPTINNKLLDYRNDLIDEIDGAMSGFYEYTLNTIIAFCGFHEEDDSTNDYLFEYSIGDLTIDELIKELSRLAIDIANIPEGHIMVRSSDFVKYIPEKDNPFAFLDCEE